MSNSKFTMAQKLQKVQVALMKEEISETSYDVLLPLIFKKCYENGLTFWFNFLEDALVLNLRDTMHENYELNIRYAYGNVPTPFNENGVETAKINILLNAFLITTQKTEIVSSAQKQEKKGNIKMSNAVPPTSIRTVIDMLEKNGDSVTKANIEKYLQFDKMSQDNRRRCIAFLRTMED